MTIFQNKQANVSNLHNISVINNEEIAMTNDMSTLSATVVCGVLRWPIVAPAWAAGPGPGPAPPDKISRDEEEKQLQQETRG